MIAAKTSLLVVGALVLQVCLLARFSFDGARPDVMVLLAIAAGLAAGPERGAIVGFAAGVAFDVVLSTPFGLSALVYTLVGWSVGSVAANVVRAAWWIWPAVVGAASVAAVVAHALVGVLIGQPTLDGPPLTAIVVVVALVNAVLASPAVRGVRWALADDLDHRRRPFFAR